MLASSPKCGGRKAFPGNSTPGLGDELIGLLPLPAPTLPLPLLLLLRADSGEREGRGILLLCTDEEEEAPAYPEEEAEADVDTEQPSEVSLLAVDIVDEGRDDSAKLDTRKPRWEWEGAGEGCMLDRRRDARNEARNVAGLSPPPPADAAEDEKEDIACGERGGAGEEVTDGAWGGRAGDRGTSVNWTFSSPMPLVDSEE